MAKKSKLKTPDWIVEGYNSEAEYNKAKQKTGSLANLARLGQVKEFSDKKKTGKTFKVRVCPECGSEKVSVVLVGEEGKKADSWECHKCKWTGKNIKEIELNEGDFLKRMGQQEDKND